jgi:hypothetical protein
MKFSKKIFFVLLFALCFLPKEVLSESGNRIKLTAAEQKEIENTLIENAKKLNQNLPIMLDPDTRFDTALAVGMEILYKYTMVNLTADSIDSEIFRAYLQSNIIKSQKADKGAMLLLKVGVACNYSYFDKNGILITKFKVDGAMCEIK